MVDKVIVSNRSALLRKYGGTGLKQLQSAVKALIAADKSRGIISRLIYLDDAAAMRRCGGRPVEDRESPRENKAAIDAIYVSLKPDYLMILGSIDVVPHQDLTNPIYDPIDDPDRSALGDLPYACEAPYSRDIAKFCGPTRVVGRLPDLTSAREPSHIVRVLASAAGFKSRPAADYSAYFGLSTVSWQKSTALSLGNIFGDASSLTLSPKAGPGHPSRRLAPLTHFINCHGGDVDPCFYGEEGDRQPKSLSSKAIAGRITPGTVAAVECCFGAQLYDSVTLALPIPICQEYLSQGAYGYFGSSTIAYGPAKGNGTADLITQYFLLSVLEGESLGMAALVARLKFVEQTGELDPTDLKTLAQFSLLGDPSVKPVVAVSATSIPVGIDGPAARRQQRHENRAKAKELGDFLRSTKPTASKKARAGGGERSPSIRQALANIAQEAGIDGKRQFSTYTVKRTNGMRAGRGKAVVTASRYFVAVYREQPGQRSVAAVAKEVDGRILAYRIYEEKSWRAMHNRSGSRVL